MSMRTGNCCAVVVASLQASEDGARDVVGATEEIVYEYAMNLDDLSQGTVQARLTAIVNRGAVAGTATYNLRLGAGTPGTLLGAGTIKATITTTSAADEIQTNLGATFANPAGGAMLVQVTAAHSSALGTANIRGMHLVIA